MAAMEQSDVHPASQGSALRRRYLDFIDRHEIAWELTFAVLAILFVIVGFAEESAAVTGAEAVLTVVFLAEFTTRFAASYDRPRYLRGHWIDLLALIPTTRSLRLLRLGRLLSLPSALGRTYPG